MSSLGSLVVSLSANTAAFSKDLGRAAHEADKRMKDITDAAEKAGKLIGVAMVAAAGTMAVLVKQSINSADAMFKLSQGAGLTTKTFSELSYVAGLAGVSTESLSTSLTRLNRNISDTAAGTGEARNAFAALGIEVKTVDGSLKNADAVMEEVADKFAGMEDGAGKSAIAVMLFGRAGAAMIPMLNEGAGRMRELRDEARALGVTIDTETGRAAERFNDNLTRLNTVKQGLANTIMRELLPQMNEFTDAMVEAAKKSEALESAGRGAVILFQTLAVLGSDVAFVFKMIGGEIGVWAAQLSALARGDFAGFKLISDEWTKDAAQARQDLDAFQARIMNLKAATEGGALGDVLGKKGAAPGIAGTSGKDTFSSQIQEGLDEWQRVQDEANALIVEQRDMELEAEQAHFNERMRILMEYYDAKTAAEEEAAREAFELTAKYMTAAEKFTALSYHKQAQTIFGELANITAGVAHHNKTLFELNKVAGIAMAIVNAYEGISLTMAKYPYPLNIAMAAAHGIAAFAQVSAIRATTFGGGGGSAPSITGSTPATPVTDVQSGAPGGGGNRQLTVINLQGDTVGRRQLRDLVDQLNENSRDGSRFVLA